MMMMSKEGSSTTAGWRRFSASSVTESGSARDVAPEVEPTDVVIVGAGPSGLSAAIRLKQLAQAAGKDDFRVVVLEKGSEVGAHILSGAVLEPRSLTELLPNWQKDGAPLNTPVTSESWQFLLPQGKLEIPILFPELKNHGNYIISLGELCRWLAEQAEALGVEIFPGFAATELMTDADNKQVLGVVTNDVGVAKDGSIKDSFQRGMGFGARLTILAEGCRGYLTGQLEKSFGIRPQYQTYGLGMKEVWRVADEHWRPGHIQHTFGWPLDSETYGGSFLYHYAQDNLVSAGFVVGLTYKNPYLDPYKEFQRWKTHPRVREVFEGGECLHYGARAISAGGLQSLSKLAIPGAAFVGDCAGFLNVPKIKGSHSAIKSGSLCAEAAWRVFESRPEGDSSPVHLTEYESDFKKSWLYDELYQVRNFKPAWKWGTYLGAIYGAVDTFVLKGKVPWTLNHGPRDATSLRPAAQSTPIEYPKPDGKLTFDRLENVARTNTGHEEDQPCHLTLADPELPVKRNLAIYAGPEARFCPAGVYEYVEDADGKARLQINQTNCIHCKTCDIKDDNITWVHPEGGGGPLYAKM